MAIAKSAAPGQQMGSQLQQYIRAQPMGAYKNWLPGNNGTPVGGPTRGGGLLPNGEQPQRIAPAPMPVTPATPPPMPTGSLGNSTYTGSASTSGPPGSYPADGLPSAPAPTAAPVTSSNVPAPVSLPPTLGSGVPPGVPPPVGDPAVGNLTNGPTGARYDNSPEALAASMALRNAVAPGAGIINPGMWGGGGPGGGPTGPMDPVNVGTNMPGNPNLPQHVGNGHDMGNTQQGARTGPHRDPNWRPPAFDWTAFANGQAQPHNPADWANKFLPGTTGRPR